MTIARPLARPLARSIASPIARSVVGSSGSSFSLAALSPLQWVETPTYSVSTLENLPVLQPSETGTLAIPRGQRCYLADGVNDTITWTAANTGTQYVTYYNPATGAWSSPASLTHNGTAYVFSPGNIQFIDLKRWSIASPTTTQIEARDLTTAGSGLVSWHPCQEESGTTAYDIANATPKNGTLNNGLSHSTHSGVNYSYPNEKGYTLSGAVVRPRNEAAPTLDAAGGALGNAGPLNCPMTTEVPCLTGDAVNAYAALGAIGSSSDFTLSFYYYQSSSAARYRLVDVGNNAGSYAWSVCANMGDFDGYTANAVHVGLPSVFTFTAASSLTVGDWHKITVARSGNTWTLSVLNLRTGVTVSATPATSSQTFDSAAVFYLLGAYNNAGSPGISLAAAGSIANVELLEGGVTTYVPLQEGAGRTLYTVKSDGTSSTLSSAIVNGTITDVWAVRCPYVGDWCVRYGGTLVAGVFIPGRIGVSTDAAGNTKGRQAGKFGNTNARRVPNYWSMPSLVNVGLTSSTKLASSDSLAAFATSDTAFSRVLTSGTDRDVVFRAALTGANLTGTQSYTSTGYINRVAAEGGSMTAAGRAAVTEIFAAAADNGVTISSGWIFGSAVNVSKNLSLNLVDGGPSLVPTSTLNASSSLSAGLLGLRITAEGEGLTTDNGSGLFGWSEAHNVLLIATCPADEDGGLGVQKIARIMDQGVGSGSGNIQVVGGNTGGLSFIDRPSSAVGMGGGTSGGSASAREYNIDPIMLWIKRNSDNTTEGFHAGENSSGGTGTVAADPSGNALRLGEGDQACDLGFAVLIRFDGTMTDEQRLNVFNRIWAAWRTYGKALLIVGNSVTIPSVTNAYTCWAKQLQRWGAYNNCIVVRRAQGARKLAYFAPTGYALPGPPSDSEIATMPVNVLSWFAANVIINDEQQNAVANNQPWSNFLHTHNAIVDYFADMNSDTRAVICTQMPWPAYQDLGLTTPANYAYVVSDNRQRFLTASQSARSATLTDFANVPTAVADVYSLLNLGWGSGDDGNAADPVNDLPNGDPAKFHDLAHPNQTGQDLMFVLYKDALVDVLT